MHRQVFTYSDKIKDLMMNINVRTQVGQYVSANLDHW